jgi:nucleotide-binding universal stress UspA family protein
MTSPPELETILVGADTSPGAAAALSWAVAEARLRGSHLRIVHVLPALRHVLSGSTGDEYYGQLQAEAETELDAALAAFPELEEMSVTREIVFGNAAEVLVDASGGAALLVVGSRGLGGFAGVVLGSVSAHCAHLAHCPVVIVRKEQ